MKHPDLPQHHLGKCVRCAQIGHSSIRELSAEQKVIRTALHNISDYHPVVPSNLDIPLISRQKFSAAPHTDTHRTLYVAHSATRITLLGGDSARRRTCGRFMPRLAAVVAESLFRRTTLGNVTNYTNGSAENRRSRNGDVRLPHLKQPFLEN
jgi:hypothetical protein